MKLSITQRDIQRGYRGNPYSCPIALALERACAPAGEEAHVGPREVRIGPGYSGMKSSYRHAYLSKKAMMFIDDFDRGRPVSPFTTILRFI